MRAALRCALFVLSAVGRTSFAAAEEPIAEEDVTAETVDESAATVAWREQIERAIQDGEYRARPDGDDFVASNRAQNLRVRFDEEGTHVTARTGSALSLHLGIASYGTELALDAPVSATPAEGVCPEVAALDEMGKCLPRVEFVRGTVTEWWSNTPSGLEHGYTIAEAPEGGGLVVVEVMIDGASVQVEESGTDVRLASEGTLLQYGGLLAFDAEGLSVPAWFEPSALGVNIVVDAAKATWPVTIDPLLTAVHWTKESDQVGAWFGTVVASAGDVNGDGFGDVLVGAPSFDVAPTADLGRAYLYLGAAAGLSTTPSWTKDGVQDGARFAEMLASAGDVNGDGRSDVLIAAHLFTNVAYQEGRVWLYLGVAGSTGLASSSAWVKSGNVAGQMQFGRSLAFAGDVNGDGYGDVIIGAFGYENGQTDEGIVYAYHGSASGLGASAAWFEEGGQAGANFGWAVASAGDVNGDGYSDVITAAPNYDNPESNEGMVWVYLGSSTGLQSTAVWGKDSNQASAGFGRSVASAGDVNGDGRSDVIIGAQWYDAGQTDEGRAYVYLGAPIVGLASSPVWTSESNVSTGQHGASVASAGDVNGDGYSDVIVGAPGVDTPTDSGRASTYFGTSTGVQSVAAWSTGGLQAGAAYGYSVASAGGIL